MPAQSPHMLRKFEPRGFAAVVGGGGVHALLRHEEADDGGRELEALEVLREAVRFGDVAERLVADAADLGDVFGGGAAEIDGHVGRIAGDEARACWPCADAPVKPALHQGEREGIGEADAFEQGRH